MCSDDTDCQKTAYCKGKEVGNACFDGRDNDHDGRVDCDGQHRRTASLVLFDNLSFDLRLLGVGA